jgi:hypothetical protein
MGNPVYLYRVKDGEVEAGLFDSDNMPQRGWAESPDEAKEKAAKSKAKPKSAKNPVGDDGAE